MSEREKERKNKKSRVVGGGRNVLREGKRRDGRSREEWRSEGGRQRLCEELSLGEGGV